VENWKPVAGAAGRYEVSDQGRVKSLVGRKERLLKPGVHPRSGHRLVSLAIERGTAKAFWVHRLVLEAFVGPCPAEREACHNDGDPGNNNVGNLRWGTRSENRKDSVNHGTHQHAKKTHCPQGHAYDRVYTRRTGPKAGATFRACSRCDSLRNRKKES
jgi:hypothetical protein